MVPVIKENTKLKLVLTIPTGLPITLVKEVIEILPLYVDKTIQVLPK